MILEFLFWVNDQIFGFQECIEGMKRLATVKCINDYATVYFISRNEFVERFNAKNKKDVNDDEKNTQDLIQIRKNTLKIPHQKYMEHVIRDHTEHQVESKVILKSNVKSFWD